MAVLDQVKQMQEQGMQENQIITSLQEQGISPKEINDALSQVQIKNAISGNPNDETMQQSQDYYSQQYTPGTQEMQDQNQYYQEQPQQFQDYSNQNNYAPTQGYGYSGYQSENTDTMIEISEQVFNEKMKSLKKQLEKINEFITITETKMKNDSNRLQAIEKIINTLQIQILDKVGSYGTNLNSIKKEMSMMQDSFRKVVDSAVKNKTTKTVKKNSSKK